jgi:hypothetical protein
MVQEPVNLVRRINVAANNGSIIVDPIWQRAVEGIIDCRIGPRRERR